MKFALRTVIVMSLVLEAGCATGSGTPATTPTTTTPTTSVLPGTVVSTATTTFASTATVDRLNEIAAIFEDLERRRLQAIFDHDEKAFRALYANDAYLNESLIVLDLANVADPSADFHQSIGAIVHDGPNCVAAVLSRDYTDVLSEGGSSSATYVAEMTAWGWGLTWVGEGWSCNGPHPLS